MNNIIFDGTAPVLEGSWVNPRTGDRIDIKDSFFSDNEYIITTRDGRTLTYSALENYIRDDSRTIKVVKEENNKKPSNDNTVYTTDFSDPYINENIFGSDIIISEPVYNIPTKEDDSKSINNINYEIIHRALKDSSLPVLNIKVEWNDIPLESIKILTDILSVDKSDIVEYFMNRIEEIPDWKGAINEYIKKTIKNGIKSTTDTEKGNDKKTKTNNSKKK